MKILQNHQYSYDAWGRLRDPANHVPYSPDNQPNLLLGRGYTGHEHLPWFGLIHCNARLYDPVVGRFLAADPIIDPTNSQSLNRYSYCLNNPLKYNDLTGMYPYMWDIVRGCYTDTAGNPVSNDEIMDYIRGYGNRGKDRGGDGFGWDSNGYFDGGGIGGGGGAPGGSPGYGRDFSKGYAKSSGNGNYWEYYLSYYTSSDGGKTWRYDGERTLFVIWEPEKPGNIISNKQLIALLKEQISLIEQQMALIREQMKNNELLINERKRLDEGLTKCILPRVILRTLMLPFQTVALDDFNNTIVDFLFPKSILDIIDQQYDAKAEEIKKKYK